MYVPKHFAVNSQTQLHTFIENQGFGVLVGSDLEANHLPFILRKDEGKHGTLYGHFARANPQWKSADGADMLVIFSGPHAYISPSWYEESPAVPTWDFISVHAKGRLSLLSAEATTEVLNASLTTFEPALLKKRDIVTPAIQEKLSPAIVGFSIELHSLQGKAKLSQNTSEKTQTNIQRALADSENHTDKALAQTMAQFRAANLTKASK